MHRTTHLFKMSLASLAGTFLFPLILFSQSFATPGGSLRPVELREPALAAIGEGAAPPASARLPQLFAGREPAAALLTPAQKALRAAERHFLNGKFLIQEGKPEEARRAFDEAVDVLLGVPVDAEGREAVEKRLDEFIRLIHRYDLEALGSGAAPGLPQFVPSPLDQILDLTFPVDPRLRDRTLAQVHVSPSQMPLVINDAVLGYINYFTGPRGSRILLAGLRRSGRYRAMIQRILDEEGVPRELIHLAQAESAFLPRALSRAKAAGMWQFVRGRGAEYGLRAGKLSDDRLDPEKATRAAARHLRDLFHQTGDWHLAMAAYNCGPLCVERAVQRTGYADFWELRARNALPRETMNYVPAILAIAIIAQNPAAYGLPPVEFEDALSYDTLKVSADTSLALIADAADLPVAEIRDLNPALLGNVVPAGFEVRVPKGKGQLVLAAIELVPDGRRASSRLHRIRPGDTMAGIARRYSTSLTQLAAANGQGASAAFAQMEEGGFVIVPAQGKRLGVRPAARTRAVSRTGGRRRASAAAVKVAARSSRTAARRR